MKSPFTGRKQPPAAPNGDEAVLSPGDRSPRRHSAPSSSGATDAAASDGGGPEPGGPGSGRDLAHQALRAAQEAAAARGRTPGAAPANWRRSAGAANRRNRRRWSGAGDDDRDPQPLGKLAEKLLADRGWRKPLTEASVLGRWDELVGPDIAEHSTPVSLRDGELVVAATSTAWATQLRTLQRELLRRIAAGVGAGVVKRIKVQGPAAPSWRKGPRTVRGRGPRDTYG
jgi:predicted nucleic acid-binding Zn ribbon protein